MDTNYHWNGNSRVNSKTLSLTCGCGRGPRAVYDLRENPAFQKTVKSQGESKHLSSG